MAKKAARQHRALAPIRELVAGDSGGGNGVSARHSEDSDGAAAGQATGNGSGPAAPIIDVGDDLISTQKRIVAGALLLRSVTVMSTMLAVTRMHFVIAAQVPGCSCWCWPGLTWCCTRRSTMVA